MNQREAKRQAAPGRYLEPVKQPTRHNPGPRLLWARVLRVAVLLCLDGLLLYMIVGCLIQPVYGGLFIAIVSVNLGYLL